MPNKSEVVPVMGIHFISLSRQEFLDQKLYPVLDHGGKCFVVTANPDITMQAKENADFRRAVTASDYVVPDGAGIVLASKYLKRPVAERIPGYELMVDVLAYANENRLPCYFLGAKEDVNAQMVQEVTRHYPNIPIAGRHHGFFELDDEQVARDVLAAAPAIVFVALGAPRQETWISKYMDQFDKGLFMGVGGSFDVFTGNVKRAPEAWIQLNLEWLYRLLKQPFRWKRIWKSLKFMLYVLWKKE
ncbi:glycosyltransferase [Lentibacillus lipolyticus]|nr:glycosyltransferase [Lentibacillus lipolyticus]